MSANFTPTRQPQTPLEPFRYWCQQVLPLVYDDSLSYYELLNKLVDYLNKTMEDISNMDTDMTNVYTAYEQLQTYVNTYFDNLEVQNEINNKLDEMAEDGSLYNIIKTYTDPIVNQQNQKINALESRMDTFTSLQDGSTTGDAELQDIRVGYDGTVYNTAGNAVREQVNSLKGDLANLFEQTGTEEQVITIIPEEHEGYMDESGNINSASTLYYTQKINVKEGDKLVPHSNTVIPTFRFVTAFNGNNAVYSSGSATTESYTVPAGIDGVIVTMRYDHNITNITQERTVPIYEVKGLSDKADKAKFQKLSKSVTSLSSGNTLTLKEKDITFKNKTMTFYANITEMGTIRIGHGYKAYGGVYFDIDSTNVKRYYSYGGTTDSPTDTLEHNLTISDFIGVVITSTDVDISISVISKSGMFSYTFSDKDSGRNGSIFVTALSGTYTNCQANWHCDDYNKNIYAIGDSYFGLSNPKRWTKYVNDLGFDNWLMLAFPGMGVIDGYNGFVDALNYSIPIFALWCVGMNNPDTDTKISSTWKTYTEKFLAICKEKGITPILCTIPNVIGGSVGDTNISTMRKHSFKNQYVISSGYRYIDFANAVGAGADGNWYPDMLSDDGVHPTELGAKSLFAKAVVDMPELLSKTI